MITEYGTNIEKYFTDRNVTDVTVTPRPAHDHDGNHIWHVCIRADHATDTQDTLDKVANLIEAHPGNRRVTRYELFVAAVLDASNIANPPMSQGESVAYELDTTTIRAALIIGTVLRLHAAGSWTVADISDDLTEIYTEVPADRSAREDFVRRVLNQ